MNFFTALLAQMPDAVAKGLIWGLMALGVYITYKILDVADLTVDGTLGLEVQKDNISFGLDYGIRASEHKAGHGVNVSFTYKF